MRPVSTHAIATIIHYCTNEYRFIKKSIEEARKFSKWILIPVCDHFFNGQPEDRALLEQTYRDCPDCQFIEFEYTPDRLYSPYFTQFDPSDREWGPFWHSTSRYIAALYLPPEAQYALFLDADEIVDGDRFRRWLDLKKYKRLAAMRLASYAYVHQPDLCMPQYHASGLMVRIASFDPGQIFNARERYGLFDAMPKPKKYLLDDDKTPFVHHYTWVRTYSECMQKARTWGHRHDKDWADAIERMFRNPDDLQPLDLAVSLVRSPLFFNPLSVPVPPGLPLSSKTHPHVLRVNERDVRRREIERMIGM